MKIMTILGTRPEIIRLSIVIEKLDRFVDSHILVHTGQNYDDRLSRIFFEQLGVREPDAQMGVKGSRFGEQLGQILERAEKLFIEHRPDRVLILGDTNSGLSAIVARRLGIPVYHMEAGNRCYDDRVPEEVNRRIIDHSSSVLMPYTERSRENLAREGLSGNRVYVTGNPIKEVMDRHGGQVDASPILNDLGLAKKTYLLVTLHRAENVDLEPRLRGFVEAFAAISKEYGMPVICSCHPRTRSQVQRFGMDIERSGLLFLEPFGFFDFLSLERSAFCVLSDSGTVQEEACIMGVPNVTLRDVTERPETIECGSNILSGGDPANVARALKLALDRQGKWRPPPEYMADNVADTVVRLVTGFRPPDPAELNWRTK
jgi:UDP-N-acetylglucosamine 2-epimerase (non-hydrolysing)